MRGEDFEKLNRAIVYLGIAVALVIAGIIAFAVSYFVDFLRFLLNGPQPFSP
jgi:hypothetical protein